MLSSVAFLFSFSLSLLQFFVSAFKCGWILGSELLSYFGEILRLYSGHCGGWQWSLIPLCWVLTWTMCTKQRLAVHYSGGSHTVYTASSLSSSVKLWLLWGESAVFSFLILYFASWSSREETKNFCLLTHFPDGCKHQHPECHAKARSQVFQLGLPWRRQGSRHFGPFKLQLLWCNSRKLDQKRSSWAGPGTFVDAGTAGGRFTHMPQFWLCGPIALWSSKRDKYR